ncbi:uncharacterized protein BJ171DRAFT_577534 [Polychytrium aggregatum]|uniref:uncharacterized protein n=1 Tax=Polychytrium aggregatum TaxID=110093 RepID=UPI0022FEE6B9|nr:uncharacterized protein BJ171DRAFT_577534 [Polychytrium aggregatum]KAI9208431.1 hypothetical protein BJ171DRAFT_577534 [Polychytrium aggregatum]
MSGLPNDLDIYGEQPRRFLIIGGGIAGLTLAVAIKRVAQITRLPLQPIIFEAKQTYDYDIHAHHTLWRWAVELLIELGLGKKLGKISSPILNYVSDDAETNVELVRWPPTVDTPHSPLPDEADLGNLKVPPMLALRKIDLVRLLMMAFSGKFDDELEGDLRVEAANNSDLVTHAAEGVDADLAADGWFEGEGWEFLLPDLRLDHELASYMISPSTGFVTASFTNGSVETGTMLIGADGIHSKVRSLMSGGRLNPHHAGACIFSGITRIHMPPVDTPDELEDGRQIPDLKKEDVAKFCGDGVSHSVVGKGVSFGSVNIGNGMIGWNMIVSQQDPQQHVGRFTMAKRRQLVGAVMAAAPRASVIVPPSTPPPDITDVETDVTNPEDKWMTTRNSGPRLRSPLSSSSYTVFDEPEELGPDDAPEPASPPASTRSRSSANSAILAERRSRHRTSQSTKSLTSNPRSRSSRVSSMRVSVAMEDEVLSQLSRGSIDGPALLPDLAEPVGNLTALETRTLALRLTQPLELPHPVRAIIARSDPSSVVVEDVMDMADELSESYAGPQGHAGRIVLIGDAAHAIATNAQGSLGASLAISDAVFVAKLIAKHLLKDYSGYHDNHNLAQLAKEYDQHRVSMCNSIVREARAEGGWGRTGNGWVRSLWRFSQVYTPQAWKGLSYVQMLTRGRIPSKALDLMDLSLAHRSN